MIILYIITALLSMGICYWTLRISKEIIKNINYGYFAKLCIVAIIIGSIINGLDYLITK